MSLPFAPPIPVPAGQKIIWSIAGANTSQAFNTCSASTTPDTGQQFNPDSAPFGPPPNFFNYISQCNWLTYPIPNDLTRPGTVIHGIYPTIVGHGNNQHSFLGLTLGNSTSVVGPALTGTVSGQWYFNFGTNASLIPTIGNQTFMESTLPIGAINDFFFTDFIGVAIYIDIPPTPSVYINVDTQKQTNIGFN